MSRVSYERWVPFADSAQVHPVRRALRAAGLDALLADDVPDPTFAVDAEGTLVLGNASLTELLARDPEGTRAVDLVLPEHERRLGAALHDALAGEGVRLTVAVVAAEGPRQVALSLIPVREPGSSEPIGALVIGRDADLENESRLERERSARLLALAGRVAGFAGWSLDLRTRELTLTEEGLPRTAAAAQHLGSLDDLLRRLSPHHAALLQRALARSAEQGRAVDVDLDLALPGIEPVHVRLVGEPVRDAGGTVIAVSGAIHDVTDTVIERAQRARAEDRLVVLSRLLDISQDAIVVRDLEHRVQYWNRGAADLYGWEADDAIGRTFDELVSADPAQFAEATAAALAEGRWSGSMSTRSRAGRVMTVDDRWQLVSDARGIPEAIFSVSADVTEFRRRADALRRAQRLESIGTVAGGIAHDLGNVLTPILLAAQMLAASVESEEDAESVAMIETAARRGTDMVQQVLSFSRGIEGRRERVEIAPLLDELAAYCRTAMPEGVTVRLDRADRLPTVDADPTQLMQVLTNLVVNARDAMPSGGTITVTARALAVGTVEGPHGEPGPWLSLAIEDTGTGMTAEVLDTLFEPFFTTKDAGRGTGLGLATSLTIARSHGGDLRAESDGVSGSRMTLLLPVPASEVPVGASLPPAGGAP